MKKFKDPLIVAILFILSSLLVASVPSIIPADPETNAQQIFDLITKNKFAEAKELIEQEGFDANIKEPFFNGTPLMTAVVFGRAEIAKLLLENGADINHSDNQGSTPLSSAIFFGQTEVFKILMDYSPDLSKKNLYQQSFLDIATAEMTRELKGIYASLGPMLGIKFDTDEIKKQQMIMAEILKDLQK